MNALPKTFQIQVPEQKLELLRKKLDLVTFPDELEEANWDYGVPLSEMKRLVDYWKTKFDWRAQEAAINAALPQFTLDVAVDDFDTLNIHFVHQRSEVQNAIPLLFVHGWPGSFLEVEKLLPLLTKPGNGTPAFHVVAPSLPGFAFSEAPSKKGFGLLKYAETCHKLMLALGYDEYVTQGGDWGFSITRAVSKMYYPDHCKASHVNMPRGNKPEFLKNPLIWIHHAVAPYNAEEKKGALRQEWFQDHGRGYFQIQSTKPQTPGYAVTDSPLGLLAWIYEKMHDWTDDYPWTEDEVLTWVSIYWFSRSSPAASFRIYYEVVQLGHRELPLQPQKTPLGISFFPKELSHPPRDFARTMGNVVFESQHSKGGHFAAHERPEALADDLKKMFGKGGAAFGVVKGSNGYASKRQMKL